VLVQNVRDFPQSKVDSEIQAPFLFLLFRHGDDSVFDGFPKISDHFPKIYKDVRRFPKIAEDFRGRPKDVSSIHQRIKVYKRTKKKLYSSEIISISSLMNQDFTEKKKAIFVPKKKCAEGFT